MSRSYKKNPFCTDGRRRTTKNTKRMANRLVRRRDNQLTKELRYYNVSPRYRDALMLDGRHYRKFFETWNIHDWVFYESIVGATKTWDKYYRDKMPLEEYLNKHWDKYYKRK